MIDVGYVINVFKMKDVGYGVGVVWVDSVG